MTHEDALTMQLVERTAEYDHSTAGLEKILEKITGIGHFVATMRPYPVPCNYQPEELAEAVSDCSVAYRGYTHPHLGSGPYGAARTTDRYAEACHDALGHMGVWRFYRSGQFKEYMGLMEDIVHDPRGVRFESSEGPRPRYLEPIWTLFNMSEVFAFASNLATSTGKRYAVSVTFNGMRGRVLDMRTGGRIGFYTEYKSHEDSIDLEPVAVVPLLDTALHGGIALEKTLELLGHFGWGGSGPRGVLAHDQEMFYAKAWRP